MTDKCASVARSELARCDELVCRSLCLLLGSRNAHFLVIAHVAQMAETAKIKGLGAGAALRAPLRNPWRFITLFAPLRDNTSCSDCATDDLKKRRERSQLQHQRPLGRESSVAPTQGWAPGADPLGADRSVLHKSHNSLSVLFVSGSGNSFP